MKGEEGNSSNEWATRVPSEDVEAITSPTNKRRQVESEFQAAARNNTKLDDTTKSQFAAEIEIQVYRQVASKVFESASTRVGGIINVYGSLDIIRPYFDVELPTVLHRVKDSLLPIPKIEERPMDLYGPVMLVFTLIAVLLFAMKDHAFDYTLKGGTLMGTSFGVCFTYWIVGSCVYKFISFLNAYKNLSFVDVLSYTGYALTGYVITILAKYLLPGDIPLVVLFVVGGLASASLGGKFFKRSAEKMPGIITGVTIGVIHFLYLSYLCWWYANTDSRHGKAELPGLK